MTAIQDEEATYYDYNPYKTQSSLNDRNASLIGFALIVAGFATSAAAALVQFVVVNIAYALIITSLALTLIGWLAILLVMQKRSLDHKRTKMKQGRKNVGARLDMQIESVEKILVNPSRSSYNFDNIRYQNLEVLVRHRAGLSNKDGKALDEILNSIKVTSEFEQLRDALVEGKTYFGISR